MSRRSSDLQISDVFRSSMSSDLQIFDVFRSSDLGCLQMSSVLLTRRQGYHRGLLSVSLSRTTSSVVHVTSFAPLTRHRRARTRVTTPLAPTGWEAHERPRTSIGVATSPYNTAPADGEGSLLGAWLLLMTAADTQERHATHAILLQLRRGSSSACTATTTIHRHPTRSSPGAQS